MIKQVLFHSLLKVNKENSKKLLRILHGIVTSTFKADLGGCGGCGVWFASWSGSGYGGCGGLSGVFPTIFALYVNDLQSEALSSVSVKSLIL